MPVSEYDRHRVNDDIAQKVGEVCPGRRTPRRCGTLVELPQVDLSAGCRVRQLRQDTLPVLSAVVARRDRSPPVPGPRSRCVAM